MNKKWIPFIIIWSLVALVFIIRGCGKDNKSTASKTEQGKTVNRDRGFDRRVSYLKYSRHAECRMDCRQISRTEVEEIMREGKINYGKSDVDNKRCPRYALEGTTSDNQRVRIVYAQCNENTTVVTVIDLEREWACDCPGDDHS